jgi:hypothetical protein
MRTERIASLNDSARRDLGMFQDNVKLMLTHGVQDLEHSEQAELLRGVIDYNDFSDGNNPHGERDFGKVVVGGTDFFWKIDYYNRTLDEGSENPADPTVTTRVLTVMKASEY